ncbi:phosphatase PAP2 family protein [Collinsella tanakaei]|uniref:phosphatase PAP2 family protein n=1 Tax=Collinsella tanakaei TaxID=626935 RepID=UPI0029428380|nr:phosphatase PAP2 family protein [Collinsella tanakaei]
MKQFDEQSPLAPREREKMADRVVSAARNNRTILLVTACAAIFLGLLSYVLRGEAMKLDQMAYWLVVENLRSDWLTPIMESFSALATPVSLIAMLLVIAAFAPGKRPGWFCTVNLALAALLNVVLKTLIQRPRPEGFRLAVESGFSFPSGHSMAAMAFFGLIVWMVWHYEQDRRQRLILTAAFSAVIAMIGISRIYLGVHYASDVLGGFCASIIWLVFYTKLAAPAFLGEDGPREVQ